MICLNSSSLFSCQQFLPNRLVQQHFFEKLLTFLHLERLVGVERQGKAETGGPAFVAFSFNFASVMVYDKITGHEVNAILERAVRTHDERIENQPQSLFWHSRTIVGDPQENC